MAFVHAGGKLTFSSDGKRAHAPWHFVDADCVVVFDQRHLERPTVEDHASDIVAQLPKAARGKRLLYCNHEGRFGRLVPSGDTVRCIDLNVHDLDEAVALARK